MISAGVEVSTYKVRYQSDDCEVVSYLSVPNACIEEKEAYPCIIYNRGGNREYSANKPEYIAYLAESSGKIIFATQYRGGDGGTGKDEFGGADLHDVLKLIDSFMAYEERSDMQQVFKELVGYAPKSDPEAYEKRSATYWAEEIKCPLLIIHSKLDERVSFGQAEKMVKALEEAGKEYKFVSYEENAYQLAIYPYFIYTYIQAYIQEKRVYACFYND